MARSASEKRTSAQRAQLLQQGLWLLGFDGDTCTHPHPGLATFIRHHGVAGILDPQRLARVPQPTFDALKAEQLAVATRALHLSATLTRVSACFSGHGVRHVAIKGPALAQQIYGRVSARAGLDVDILVPAASWSHAIAGLDELGFRLAPGQNMELAPGTHELVFHHDTLARIELHRRLLRRRYTLPSSDWDSGQVTSIGIHGADIPTLTPTFALPYLAAHANQHVFRRLIWLVDIVTLLRHAEFDAEQAAWLSRRADLDGAVDVCVTLLQRLFAIELPTPLQRLQRHSWARDALVEHAVSALVDCSSDLEAAHRIGMVRRVAIDIGLARTASGKLLALGDWLSPTARDESWLVLPRTMRLFYPVIRLARLLVQRR